MKNLLLIFSFLLLQTALSAQDADTSSNWTIGGIGNATLNQVGLKNWSAGGDPSVSLLLQTSTYADLARGNHSWENDFNVEYGFQKTRGESIRKNSDRFELATKYGYKISRAWYVSTLASFESQFSKTIDYATDVVPRRIISKIMSPANLELAIGMDYKPNDQFSLFLSPLAAKFLFVLDDDIAALGVHGNDPGENFRSELGASVIASYKQTIFKNVTAQTALKLFKDYLQGPAQNIDVDWQTTFGFKVNDFLAASIFTHMIWDYDVMVPFDVNDDGTILAGEQARKLQFRDVIGVGLSYNFGDKKK